MPVLIGVASGLAVAASVIFMMHRHCQRRLSEQHILLGDELHDQLGPLIYYSRMLVANEIRQLELVPPTMLELQSHLAQTGETVRDLSKTLRNNGSTTLRDLEAFLSMQMERWHQLGGASYVVHGEVPDLKLSLAQYTQLLRVLQELMLNSSRHAPGQSIHLAFESARRNLKIRYWDEGPGMEPSVSLGTGSASTHARMQRIGGALHVDNRFPDGYEIVLSLPL